MKVQKGWAKEDKLEHQYLDEAKIPSSSDYTENIGVVLGFNWKG